LGTGPFLEVVEQLMEMFLNLNSPREVGAEFGEWVHFCPQHNPEGRVWFDAMHKMLQEEVV
jgi:hypothetical protein